MTRITNLLAHLQSVKLPSHHRIWEMTDKNMIFLIKLSFFNMMKNCNVNQIFFNYRFYSSLLSTLSMTNLNVLAPRGSKPKNPTDETKGIN